MSPTNWGPPTWTFLHTMAEKIREDAFAELGGQLITMCVQICAHLPCPECAAHARSFWRNVNAKNVKSKIDLIHILFVFHNAVNKRKGVPAFPYEQLRAKYAREPLVATYNAFTKNFHTRGNMTLIADAFHRGMMTAKLRSWLMRNLKKFELE